MTKQEITAFPAKTYMTIHAAIPCAGSMDSTHGKEAFLLHNKGDSHPSAEQKVQQISRHAGLEKRKTVISGQEHGVMHDNNILKKPCMDGKNPERLKEELQKNGWRQTPLGDKRSNGKTKQIEGFLVFVRNRPVCSFLGKPAASAAGLPALADFESYPSLVAARPDSPCILIAFDSEWENLDSGGRSMLSWQFAVISGQDLVEICFIKNGSKNLTLTLALGFILDCLGEASVDTRKITRYQYCDEWHDGKAVVTVTDKLDTARRCCRYVYRNGKFTNELIDGMADRSVKRSGRDWAYFHTFLDYKAVENIKITLLCHTGKADLTGLNDNDYLLKSLTEIQGGLVSLQPVRMAPASLKNVSHKHIYPVSLSVADTMCHAPAGMKKLKNLGDAVGIQKIDIPDEQKNHMRTFLETDPAGFMEYASTDSVVTLMYASALYGYNNRPPVTVTSAAAAVMKKNMLEYFGIDADDTAEFNRVYRGLRKVSHGKAAIDGRPGFCENTSMEPVSEDANRIQDFSSKAYHGGYNACCEVGYFPKTTYDFDLRNAYPTSMCLVPDIDWENPIRRKSEEQKLDISDFKGTDGNYSPIMPFVCYCRFRFPEHVKYPCIPVDVDGVPVYPRSSDGLDGVYAAGPYIYLALKLGAEIFCQYGYFLNTRTAPDGIYESQSLAYAVRQFVQDRGHAVAAHGKKSLEELILKVMVNAGYGKTAQNVIEKHAWSAYKDIMETLGCSAITNPVSAMMTTAIVQCVLLAAQNQLHGLGYMSCSVTTDGFISDCPYDVLTGLDLYGVRSCMEEARLFLTGGEDPEIWEIKHRQDDLVNFTTRGNVSLLAHGVCAHNGAKSGFESDSHEDRLWLMTQVLSRTGTISCTEMQWPSFKDIVHGKTDFRVVPAVRHLRMDFDLKRKPDRGSMKTDCPVVNGVSYEMAHFDTVPYENVAEFCLYRKKKELCDCLRTVDEWEAFFLKVDTDGCKGIVKDLEWSVLASVIMGYRSGRWEIPALEGKTVAEKCAWINRHNSSSRKYKESDWKNARRPDRQSGMLPDTFLMDKLSELQADC